MIYTPHEMINGGGARKGPKPRPSSGNAVRDDLWICLKSGPKRAATRHKMLPFGRRAAAARGGKGVFSRRTL
jgi:hypothetical protein